MNNEQVDSLNCGRVADSGIDLKGSTQLVLVSGDYTLMTI